MAIQSHNESAYAGEQVTGRKSPPFGMMDQISPEEAVRIDEDQLLAIIERHHAVMLLIDPESGVIAGANRAASAFYGYPAVELRGKEINDISQVPPMQLAAELRRAKTDGFNYFISLHKLAGNELRTVEINASPITGKDRILLFAIVHDITEHERCRAELKANVARIEELNTALKVIMQQIEEHREQLHAAIVSNIGDLVLPGLDRLKNSPLASYQRSILRGIESNLLKISSSFLQKLKTVHYKLTSREIEIAALVKDGKSTREIAEQTNISTKTVEFHRSRLREKLGLKRKKINLRSHLLAIK